MQEVILCKGVPASGKSTWAKALVKNSLMWKRINRDDLRAMLDNSIHTPTNESFVVRAQNFMLLEALKRGKNVVIDDTNFAYKNFKRACRIARLANISVVISEKYFPISLEEALSRNESRTNPVPRNVLVLFYSTFVSGKTIIENTKVIIPKGVK